MNKFLLVVATIMLIFVCAAAPSFAADNSGTAQYGLGDQTLSINAGMFIPLFLLPTWTILLAGNPSHLTLGVVGSLSWAAYVSPKVRLGADIAGNFTLDPNSNVLLMLPFVVKGTYIFSFYPFEVPVTMGIGANIVKYTTLSTVDLLLRPGAAFYWIFNSSWSFGANLNYWFDVQFNTDPSLTRIGNFLEFSLSALYHF